MLNAMQDILKESSMFLNENNTANGKRQQELEYSYMAHLTDMKQLDKADSVEEYEQWILMTDDTTRGGSIRVRAVNGSKYILTMKNHLKSVKGAHNAHETEMEVTKDMFDTFKQLATFGSRKKRYVFNVPKEKYYWEVDVYLNKDGKNSEWVKLDLEVPKSVKEIPAFPMNFDRVIDSLNKTEDDKKFLHNLFKDDKNTLVNRDNILPVREKS